MKIKQVEKVIDGDSIWVVLDLGFGISLRKEIRLSGIDAPEKSTKAGKKVLTFVRDWFSKNKESLDFILNQEHDDKYGRALGEFISKENVSLNKLLLEKSLVKEFDGTGQRTWTEEELKTIEEKLINENI
jgi:micrococcal nuclease